MKRLLIIAPALVAMLAGAVPADARQGCGRGFHRGHYGRCLPNWHRRRW